MMSIDETKKPKKGRPSADTEAVNVRLPTSLLADIDVWRAKQRPIPSRPAAIRGFVEAAMTIMKTEPSEEPK